MSELSKIIKNNTKPMFMPPKMYKGRNLVYNASDKNYSMQYFAIVSIEDGNVVSFNRETDGVKLAYYVSNDLTNWSYYNDTHSWNMDKDDILYFKAVTSGWGVNIQPGAVIMRSWFFSSTKKFSVQGNIMSLIYGDDFTTNFNFDQYSSYNFYKFFYGASNLVSAKNLVLPVKKLVERCYQAMFTNCTSLVEAPKIYATSCSYLSFYYMFYGCTSLVNAPALRVVSLSGGCFQGMFGGCTSLTKAPALPATALAASCYASMFSGCTSLVNAPALPSQNTADSCYKNMFSGCTSLVNAPAISARYAAASSFQSMFSGCTSLVNVPDLQNISFYWNANNCYNSMFSRCTSLVNAPKLNQTSVVEDCYNSMFYGCTSLEKAPDLNVSILAARCYMSMFQGCTSLEKAPQLNAATLAEGCYKNMFKGCTSLNEVKCLATDRTASECVKDWLDGVSQSGTFYKSSVAYWQTGSSGIPSGWTAVDYVE